MDMNFPASKRSPDMTGKRFGRLIVVSRHGRDEYGQSLWNCLCDCGSKIVRKAGQLRLADKRGRRQSCGCWKDELTAERRRGMTTHGLTTERAGSASNKLYDVWKQMLRRCENAKSKDWRAYGGRGISVCQEWHDGATFIHWCISSGYQEGLTIERRDVNANYDPDNCTWVPNPMQSRNVRKNRYLTYAGKTLCASEWARLTGIHVQTILQRLRKGWVVERILSPPRK
jgi:hypothetical protein